MPVRRRFVHVPLVLVVALACAAAGTNVASADTTDSCYPVVGYVRDGLARPLAGARASVTASCNGPNVVYTGADGRYEIYVAGGSLGTSASVTVTKTGYVTRSQSASVKPKVGATPIQQLVSLEAQSSSTSSAQAVGPAHEVALYRPSDVESANSDFKLLMVFAPALAPTAVRPGGAVTFTVRVPAPPPGYDGNPTKVVATRTYDGAPVGLSPVLGSDGFTTWTGTTTVPLGEPDGSRTIESCATGPDETARCASAAQGTLLSSIVSPSYVVDSTPPVLDSTDPVPYGTYTRLYSAAARWHDTTSGLAANSLRVWVDGTARSTSVSGTTVYGSLSGVGAGIHSLEVEATDRAGNTASAVRIFTIASLSASAASATLARQSVAVNPGATLPPPSTVTFRSPRVDVGAFSETVGAATWVGHGQVRRPFSFGTATVEFVNETGVAKVVTVTMPTTYAPHELALLTPSASAATAKIPAAVVRLADITVTVPTGYGTPGSQATLKSVTAALGSPDSTSAQLAATPFTGRTTIAGSLASCASEDPQTVQCDDGALTAAGIPVATVPGPDGRSVDELDTAPLCQDAPGVDAGAGCVAAEALREAKARVYLGCATSHTITLQNFVRRDVNLCDIDPAASAPEAPFATAALNGWVYGVRDAAGATRYASWHQSYVDTPAAGGACPNGSHGAVRAWLYRGAANVVALDGASQPALVGVWRPRVEQRMLPPRQVVRLGRQYGAGAAPDGGVVESGTDDVATFQLDAVTQVQPVFSDVGDYYLVPGATVNAFGGRTESQAATSALWEYAGAGGAPDAGPAGTDGFVALVTGTLHGASSQPGYQRLFSLDVQLVADFGGCG